MLCLFRVGNVIDSISILVTMACRIYCIDILILDYVDSYKELQVSSSGVAKYR